MIRRRPAGRIASRNFLAGLAMIGLASCTTAGSTTTTTPSPTDANAAGAPRLGAVRPAPVIDDPARLIGLDAAGLTALFGPPVRVRRDGTAEIRQFGAISSCQIDAFLYPDAGKVQVTHVELRRGLDRLDPSAARACMRSLIGVAASS